MEDRTSHGLYLEMTDRSPSDYVHERSGVVAMQRGGSPVTLWRNAHRDRADLPRVIDEFSTLAVDEVDATFVAPDELPHDIRSLHFVRTPRPGQGTLSGRPTTGLSVVLISPREPADAQALRDWADFVHIRYIAQVAVPGYTMITPYINERADAHPKWYWSR